MSAPRVHHHLGTAPRRGRLRAHPRPGRSGQDRTRPAKDAPRRGAGRQGLLLARHPSPPVQTRIKAVIAIKDDQHAGRRRKGSRGGRPPSFDKVHYRDRNTVERAVNKLRAHRAVATRYDKRDYIYRGTITVATIWIWLRDPVPDPITGHALIGRSLMPHSGIGAGRFASTCSTPSADTFAYRPRARRLEDSHLLKAASTRCCAATWPLRR